MAKQVLNDNVLFAEQRSKINSNFSELYDANVELASEDGASLVGYLPSGAGAVASDVQSKLRESVSVKDFGAVLDGVTNDRNALQAALNTGKSVLIPDGTLLYNTTVNFTADGQCIFGFGNTSILKSGSASAYINSNGFDNLSVRDLKIDGTGTSGGIVINGDSQNFLASRVYFYKGSQRVWLFECDLVTVDTCAFEECGYQVIQQAGYSSSDCKVVGCTSINCENDFVELNCEVSNPSKNWLVANNTVKNVGMVGATNAKTESRFVGATSVDGIVITGNMVDGVAGDSAVHLERPGRTIITGNTFRNVNGYATVYLIPGAAAGWTRAQDIVVSGNTFIQDTAPLGGTNRKVFVGSIDGNYYNNINVSDNQFYYYGTDYPGDPAVKDYVGVDVGFNLNFVKITGNLFKNLLHGVRLGNNSGGAPVIAYLPVIDYNHFDLCTTGVTFTGTTAYAQSISFNQFKSCTSPWSSLPSTDFNELARVSGNSFIYTNVSGFASSFITRPSWLPNTYQQSTHDDSRATVSVTQGVLTPLFKMPFGFTGIVAVFAELASNGTNNKREIFFVSGRSSTSFTSLGSHTAGTAPTITLSASGTYGQLIAVTLTGGSAGAAYNVRVSFN